MNTSNKYQIKWYDVFFLSNEQFPKIVNNVNDIDDDVLIEKSNDIDYKLINNIEMSYNHNNILLFGFYNSLNKYGRNILHDIYLNNKENSYLYDYVIINDYVTKDIHDVYGLKPIDYYIPKINNIFNYINVDKCKKYIKGNDLNLNKEIILVE